ncbi:succinate dehydrogenase assembly factor 2 [Phaeovibrio sulfidiphilus]|uniref:FAD assembly factor SdhE n=1 Tax=Phaeovibrio sulfidiphilus TaxID=1220600 RepID=A0A8J6YND9_9PROT|nr:succinate dehydrogenase assembly factor 2 [Phaeovibrio sulfidiphilus]MBE1237825.1 succinate dehydrogenase assembly factor 2 [Phaeovibrio sulfidiphilus]
MPDLASLTDRQKQMLYRAQHRGTKEADIFIGTFAERRIADMTPEQLDRFETLLDEDDMDIMNWILSRAPTPAQFQNDVMALLQTFRLKT